ncbi:related to vegetatible incompatibility protein HET-E-1 [Fusarium torulosum]|uniref:Related to vegetatible incompatibility protein HET-E-1 n=1 Tax=Fusarium torulosum TaxID=33205 RepID=A0AAE8M3P7_9HYPO|nr:related to vegetatible incompatibility protein HET-E-1 [Fusarium torulosum]
MSDFAARRRQNIEQNEFLLKEIKPVAHQIEPASTKSGSRSKGVKRKVEVLGPPTRRSRRIAESSDRPAYDQDGDSDTSASRKSTPRVRARRAQTSKTKSVPLISEADSGPKAEPSKDVKSIIAGWTSWEPEADEAIREADGTFHFESHPEFRPNKSPEEIIREGSFGGSYWRPLFSKRLGITVQDDWRELPPSWTTGLDVDTYLTSATYSPEVNKYGVACGQSIEEWEAAGWIAHEYDIRGWFQWYCRFWMGRRCADDERQISRWKKCVGARGRWRRILLKKYVQLGIRTVFADDDEDDEVGDVSPVVHQTCHHWAYEVRQDALERFWTEGE